MEGVIERLFRGCDQGPLVAFSKRCVSSLIHHDASNRKILSARRVIECYRYYDV